MQQPDFNPRSPHGERRRPLYSFACSYLFQSTLPARGATCSCRCCFARAYLFQSTLPARGATVPDSTALNVVTISIHAPRTGSDSPISSDKIANLHFNPRSPHGERLPRDAFRLAFRAFQSTLPARGATALTICPVCNAVIFQSTLPARGATAWHNTLYGSCGISIHAPRTGSDATNRWYMYCGEFQSTLPARGATSTSQFMSNSFPFQSTLPARGATLFMPM